MPTLSKEQIKNAAYTAISQADGYDSDELSEMRSQALDYYYNRPGAAPSAAGRSSIQSSDVADMVEAVTAQIMPAFDMENIVEWEPVSDEDVQQAATETDAVNYVVMRLNNGHYEFQQAVKDALLMRNGIVKVFVDEKVDVNTEHYKMLTIDEHNQLLSQVVPSLDAVENGVTATTEPDPDAKGFFNATVKTKTTKRKVCVKSVDPVQFCWEQDWDSIYLQECGFCAERTMPKRSDLVQMGYSKSVVSQIPAGVKVGIGETARNQGVSSTKPYSGEEPSQDLIEVYECYLRIDRDGDGVAELLKVVVANNTLLEAEEVEYVPYASGTPFLQPHRFNGLGLFDKLRYIQDQKTQTLRQLADNQNHANNARIGVVASQVNMADVTNSRPGGIVRMNSPDAVVPFPFTDIGPTCQGTLDYLDKIRSERGGASLDMVTAEAQIAGDTAHGVERQMTAKEQLAAQMTRTLADTLIRTTFEMVHTALRLYVTEPLVLRSKGQFTSVNPQEWQERERITVTAGLSNAERSRKQGHLEKILLRQDHLLSQGGEGVTVTQANVFNSTLDWCRASGESSAERYFADPSSEESKQAAQQKAQAAQQEQQQAQQYQQSLVDMQGEVEERKANNEDAKVIEDGRQFDANLQFEYWKQDQVNQAKEAELITDAFTGIVKDEQSNAGASAGGEQATAGG